MAETGQGKKNPQELDGYEKAAILLVSLGEEVASEVMKHLTPREIRHLGRYLTRVEKLDPAQVRAVMEEFQEMADNPESLILGGEEYVKKVLTKAMGPERAKTVLESLALEKESSLDTLRWLDPRGVANLIRGEHPQTIAIILAHLDPDQASQVIPLLPEDLRADVILRMATLETVPSTVLKEIEEALNEQLQGSERVVHAQLGGPHLVAEILNQLDRANEGLIMGALEQKAPDLAEKIRQMMFTFEDLVHVDDRGIQELLREISKEDLVLALKTASDELKEKIFQNMSERAAQNLRDDMEAKGPVRVSEVEKAQQNILRTAKRLEEEGRIVLGGKGAEEVVV